MELYRGMFSNINMNVKFMWDSGSLAFVFQLDTFS